jgi:hypothetical protein
VLLYKNTQDIRRSSPKATVALGTFMAKTGKMQTYSTTIDAILNQSLMLSPEFLYQIESFLEENKHLGFKTKEAFICDAARWRLDFLKMGYEHVKIPREKYEKLVTVLKEMSASYSSPSDFQHKS